MPDSYRDRVILFRQEQSSKVQWNHTKQNLLYGAFFVVAVTVLFYTYQNDLFYECGEFIYLIFNQWAAPEIFGFDVVLRKYNIALHTFKMENGNFLIDDSMEINMALSLASNWTTKFMELNQKLADISQQDDDMSWLFTSVLFVSFILLIFMFRSNWRIWRVSIPLLVLVIGLMVQPIVVFAEGRHVCEEYQRIHTQHFKKLGKYLTTNYGLPGLSIFTKWELDCPVTVNQFIFCQWFLGSWLRKNLSNYSSYLIKYIVGPAIATVSYNLLFVKKGADDEFKDMINVSVNIYKNGLLSFRTLDEADISTYIPNKKAKKQIQQAAELTTATYPFLVLDDRMPYTLILNQLSRKYSAGFFAQDMELNIRVQKYHYGMTRELGTLVQAKKLRVMVASDRLLNEIADYDQHMKDKYFIKASYEENSRSEGMDSKGNKFVEISICVEQKRDDIVYRTGTVIVLTHQKDELCISMKARFASRDNRSQVDDYEDSIDNTVARGLFVIMEVAKAKKGKMRLRLKFEMAVNSADSIQKIKTDYVQSLIGSGNIHVVLPMLEAKTHLPRWNTLRCMAEMRNELGIIHIPLQIGAAYTAEHTS